MANITNVAAIVGGLVENQSLASNTLAASAITASSTIMATGAITAANFSGSSSGTNTGDQTITLTGDVTGSGTGSFATVLAATSNSTLTTLTALSLPYTQITGAPAAGANTTLSNLTSPTAINQNLLSATGNTYTLGNISNAWSNVISNALSVSDGSNYYAELSLNGSTPSSINTTANLLFPQNNKPAGIWTSSQATSTQSLLIETGNAAGGNSGNIELTTGTATGTRGQIQLVDGSQGTIGYVWTSTDVNGSGHWAATSTGSAITALTGDVTATGPGSATATLTATSNATITSLSALTTATSLGALGAQTQALNMNSNQINNLSSPSASTDAVNKGYVDAAINGLTWKGPVQAFANSNVALTGGATLTVDGYSVQNGDYVILSNQTTASQNYVYVASGIGTAYTLTEVTGSEAPTATGDAYLIEKGTQYGNTAYQVNAISPNVTFIQFAGPAALTFTSPLLLTGNVVTIGYDNSTIGNNGSNQLYIPNGGVTETQINNSALSTTGALAGGSGTKLSVKTDGSTISINGSDQLSVPTSGIGTTQLASASVTAAKLGSVTDGITTNQSGSGSTIQVLQSPAVAQTFTAGQSFAANTSYLVRMGITANSETANRVYAADASSATTNYNFWVVGIANGGSGVTAGNPISVTMLGTYTLASGDTGFSTGVDEGHAVWLTTSGAFSTVAPSTSGYADVKVGTVQSAGTGAASSIMFGNVQLTGIN